MCMNEVYGIEAEMQQRSLNALGHMVQIVSEVTGLTLPPCRFHIPELSPTVTAPSCQLVVNVHKGE